MVDHRRALEAALAETVEGEVRFDRGTRAVYSTDASNHRELPLGVVFPRTKDDVVAAVATARRHGAPVLPRGGGTSLAGQGCNAALALDMTRHQNRILEVDPDARTARVQPGVVLDRLQEAARPHGLRFGPDPATHASCTLGGMIGNDACGVHSVLAGRTVDNVVSLEVLTYDGTVFEVGPDDACEPIGSGAGRRAEIHRRMRDLRDRHADRIRAERRDLPRRVSGYNLEALLPEHGFDLARALVGSEGTLATILEATVRLIEWPPARSLLVIGYPDVYAAADHVPEILEHDPIGLEGIDTRRMRELSSRGVRIEGLDLLPGSDGWLLVEFGGSTPRIARERAGAVAAALERRSDPPAIERCDDERAAMAWAVRESGLRAVERAAGSRARWPGWEDSAVHPDRLADYLRDLRDLLDDYDLETSLYGHFGDGCVHARISFDLASSEGVETYRRFLDEAAALCCGEYGGSLSGEHGDGLARGALLDRMYSAELLEAMREMKAIWDPESGMNPGRLVEADDVAAHLRLGADYGPAPVETRFAYPDDDGEFARAVLRCAGIGTCRRDSGGTMCPSWMATRDERHSTRGRARILFEMLNGEEIDGWRDEAVLESLELCLGCKGCKSDCPVSVDMATYKAEFLSHHYAKRARPRAHYAMGLIPWSARLAARIPGLANRALRAPGLSSLIKWAAGIAAERELPTFAEETFRDWFRSRDPAPREWEDRPEVVLFPDTFNEHFHPGVARAAVEVLEWAGWRVSVPPERLCCARPLFHYGMLDLARRQQRKVLDALRPKLRAGVPVVGLEPSCVAAFRDELPGLFPDDEDAARLRSATRLFSEFLAHRLEEIELPAPGGRALLHVHCHQKSVLSHDADRRVLDRLGYACEVPETGCCGMAGSFGFERGEPYEVSVACGERALLPAVRGAGPEVDVVTSGYSCREQIEQSTDRPARHLAEVVRDAIDCSLPTRRRR
ncbi:MAG: FAD-linked oxidase C-terminal domain-containing protein [Gemmatimonadota bacterium]|nr:FAD-linked oxidase C-terminal domain-containing protein [Gemmatimonadota bacterium]